MVVIDKNFKYSLRTERHDKVNVYYEVDFSVLDAGEEVESRLAAIEVAERMFREPHSEFSPKGTLYLHSEGKEFDFKLHLPGTMVDVNTRGPFYIWRKKIDEQRNYYIFKFGDNFELLYPVTKIQLPKTFLKEIHTYKFENEKQLIVELDELVRNLVG